LDAKRRARDWREGALLRQARRSKGDIFPRVELGAKTLTEKILRKKFSFFPGVKLYKLALIASRWERRRAEILSSKSEYGSLVLSAETRAAHRTRRLAPIPLGRVGGLWRLRQTAPTRAGVSFGGAVAHDQAHAE